MRLPLYQAVARIVEARANCLKSENHEWVVRWEERLRSLARKHLPRGSGIDSGTEISLDSEPDKLILTFGFHHMDDVGQYTHWTHQRLEVVPSLAHDFDLKITQEEWDEDEDDEPCEFDGWCEQFDLALREEVEAT